jgi:predicted kinase
MPKCYQLIGIPASGKSTWVSEQEWAGECSHISTDKYVEDYAKEQGKTYSEVFKDYMPTAVDLMAAEVVKARTAGRDIIWDQTSTTVASRTRKFRMLPDYEHIAVVFRPPYPPELSRRLASRPGKIIPVDVIEDMIKNFEVPSEEEGFKEIWVVNQ